MDSVWVECLLWKPCRLSLRILYLSKCAITLLWMTCSSSLQVMEVIDTGVVCCFVSFSLLKHQYNTCFSRVCPLSREVHCRGRSDTVVIGYDKLVSSCLQDKCWNGIWSCSLKEISPFRSLLTPSQLIVYQAFLDGGLVLRQVVNWYAAWWRLIQACCCSGYHF